MCSAQGQIIHCKLRNQDWSFTRDWIVAVASLCFLYPPLFSIWTELIRSEKIPGAPTWRWGEWICLTGPSGLHWNSPQGLNISSIWIFDQIRDMEIPITLPVGTSSWVIIFVLFCFSSPVRQMSGNFRPTRYANIILSIIIINTHSLRAPMTWDVDAP